MSVAASSIPQSPAPYNVRVYKLGAAREGVFLNSPVCRRVLSADEQEKRKQEKRQKDRARREAKKAALERAVYVQGDLFGAEQEEAGPGALEVVAGEDAGEEAGRGGSIWSARRAATRVRRLAEANRLDTMFSLTFDTAEVAKIRSREVVGDLSARGVAWKHFGLFRRRFAAWCEARGFVCDLLAVSEMQKRGVWHFHAATALPVRHADLMPLWGYGAVWISGGAGARRRKRRKPGSDASYVAAYISKYMVKDMEEGGEAGRGRAARYSRSRALVLPFDEHLIEAGDISAFEEHLTEGGFEIACSPVAIEKDGENYGWWARSVKMAIEAGDLARPPVPAAGGADGRAGAGPHLKYEQVAPKPKTPTPKNQKQKEKDLKKRGWGVVPKPGGGGGGGQSGLLRQDKRAGKVEEDG